MTAKIKLNAASGGGSFSLQAPSSSSNNRVMTLPDTADGTILTTTNPKAGNIIQVVQTVKTDVASTTNNDSFEDISGMSVSITPSATSSKILLMVDMRLSTKTNANIAYKFLRDSTQIYMGDASGSITRATGAIRLTDSAQAEMQTEGGIFLDSPNTTSSTTYKVQWTNTYHTNASYINRSFESTDSNDRVRAASSITVMEVAG